MKQQAIALLVGRPGLDEADASGEPLRLAVVPDRGGVLRSGAAPSAPRRARVIRPPHRRTGVRTRRGRLGRARRCIEAVREGLAAGLGWHIRKAAAASRRSS